LRSDFTTILPFSLALLLRSLFPWLFLLFLFLASCDDQVPKGVSDLFTGLLVGHDGVTRCPPSSASVATALLRCLLLEESCTDLFVEHPDDGLDDVRFVFTCGRFDIPLEVHLDRDSETSISNVVVGPAVASAHNIVRSGFGDDVAVVIKRTIHVVVVPGDRINVDVVVHYILVHAVPVELVAVHDIGGSVDHSRSRVFQRAMGVVRVVADHTAVAHGYSSR